MEANLDRFIKAQEENYSEAIAEIRSGQKKSHWMWYVFPQLKGLGISETSNYYGLRNIDEANNFLHHPILGENLVRICKALEGINGKSAYEIFGTPDDLKLHSSLTLFSLVKETNPIFQQLINKYFDGKPDQLTLKLLGK
ncbi:DUF1810 domain-containing protein [Pedobacter ureilyticus]|uniref:DUF1810 domain-containing protein n=1 Tax=Pedobacter ureilyticus TaxID=1393051 RepID=A0ABW9J8C6_9SPHI|nr:DUF1810 domain-containing protein [Pedobacter helvus]